MFLPIAAQAQIQTIEKLLVKGEYDLAYKMIEESYAEDTMNIDRLHSLYSYYMAPNNSDKDSLTAFIYARLYNMGVDNDKRIDLKSFAQKLLANIYKTKNVEKFNKYIDNTIEYPALNKEAQRIRDNLAFEKAQESNTVEAYKEFVTLYPNSMQADDARIILNEKLFQELLNSNDVDSLKSFISLTTSEKYKKQALKELDKLSFNKALKENTLESYNAYISEFPDGEFILVAKNKRDLAQYDRYVNEGNIVDLVYYIRNNNVLDKNYKVVLDKLRLKAIQHYSLLAMQVLDSVSPDAEYLRRFAKKYVSDYSLASVERLLAVFPSLKSDPSIADAESKAKQLNALNTKKELSLEDYKKHKNLFTNLSARETAKVFSRFEAINQSQPKGKMLNFDLALDEHYVKYLSARNMEMDFVLTDDNYDASKEDRPDMATLGIDVSTDDAYYVNDSLILFSAVTEEGYDFYENSKNNDIYYSIYKDDKWQKPVLLNSLVNTRFNETNPVLSLDKKTLWFSSDRDLNFGGLDIYVCYRTDVNDWNSWTEPILLGEDFNTQDDDYVLHISDNLVVLSQDEEFKVDNNIYLEGKTNMNFFVGQLKVASNHSVENLKVNILNKNNLSLSNIARTNSKGYFSFLNPQNNSYLFSSQRSNFYTPLSNDSIVNMYYVEEMVSRNDLVTIASPFDSKNCLEFSKQGLKELQFIAQAFKKSPYLLTIEIHPLSPFKKMTIEELSEEQAKILKDFLVKNGVAEDQLIVNGVVNKSVTQGWEKIPSIDISLINKY